MPVPERNSKRFADYIAGRHIEEKASESLEVPKKENGQCPVALARSINDLLHKASTNKGKVV